MPGGQEVHKAAVAAALIGAVPFPDWYDKWAEGEESRIEQAGDRTAVPDRGVGTC